MTKWRKKKKKKKAIASSVYVSCTLESESPVQVQPRRTVSNISDWKSISNLQSIYDAGRYF